MTSAPAVPEAASRPLLASFLPGPEGCPPDEALDTYLRARLAAYKIPKRWIRIGELPRNITGKVLKVDLRKRFADRA